MSCTANYFRKIIFSTLGLALGCTSGGSIGCGGSAAGVEESPTVDSNLPAIYQITSYQGDTTGCDQPADIDLAPSYLVFYAFRPDTDPSTSRLGATFCSSLTQCRGLAEFAAEPSRGYSFIVGDDNTGWTGWAILASGPLNDMCEATVQAHMLTMSSPNTIRIESKTVDTVFMPMLVGNDATCPNADAIASLNDELTCKEIILVEAKRDAELLSN